MEKDFHYYLVYSVAKLTQCTDADIIAYSSQFVDDNNEGQFSIDNQETLFPEKILSNSGNYYPIMTQSLSPKSLDHYIQKFVYLPFHFLPGDNTVNIEKCNGANPYCCTPNSMNSKILLEKALESYNPYQIGIALHTYADTWSHQNFSGLRESWNSVYPWYNIFKSISPNIGHAEAGHSPDVISEIWTDHRLDKKIINWKRALEATREIYRRLRKFTGKGPFWTDVEHDYRVILKTMKYDDRITKINDLLRDNTMSTVPDYNKDIWIDSALDRSEGKVVMNAGFPDTHWHHFHQAAKQHLAIVMDLTKGL